MKLNIKAFSLTCGLVWGLGIFCLTWWVILLKLDPDALSLIKLYPGYAVTPVGSLIGMLGGFVDALIGGAIFAWLYNRISDWKKKS